VAVLDLPVEVNMSFGDSLIVMKAHNLTRYVLERGCSEEDVLSSTFSFVEYVIEQPSLN